eukprot:gene9043-18725_t
MLKLNRNARYLSTFKRKILSYEVIGDILAPETAVFLHGIIGSKRNWRTPTQQFIKLNPQYKGITIDLRGHGNSHNHTDTHTVDTCAKDLVTLFQHLEMNPTFLCGHSFGGKVVLAYLANQCQLGGQLPNHSWVLDSLPGSYTIHDVKSNEQSVANVFQILSSLPATFPNREWATLELQRHGVSKSVAQWLSTNIILTDDGIYKWSFDLPVLKSLFYDFCETDFWPFLNEYKHPQRINFLRAGKNPAWTPEVLKKFDDLTTSHPSIQLHHMPHAGHWMHVDDLQGLRTPSENNPSTSISNRSVNPFKSLPARPEMRKLTFPEPIRGYRIQEEISHIREPQTGRAQNLGKNENLEHIAKTIDDQINALLHHRRIISKLQFSNRSWPLMFDPAGHLIFLVLMTGGFKLKHLSNDLHITQNHITINHSLGKFFKEKTNHN